MINIGKWQIFDDEDMLLGKNAMIDALLCYPNESGNTVKYRSYEKHPTENKFYAGIDDELVNACEDMTSDDRFNYYDEDNLVDDKYLYDNGFKVRVKN